MGVKGLVSFLKRCKVESRIEMIQSGSTLVVDANGFFFQIVKDNQSDIMFHLGDYESIRYLVSRAIEEYTDRGIALVFYFDGEKQMKLEITKKRAKERYIDWEYLDRICESRTFVNNNNKLPIPVLALEQFRDTLKSLNMDIEGCDGEADQAIALYCSNMNSPLLLAGKRELYFCLGSNRYGVDEYTLLSHTN